MADRYTQKLDPSVTVGDQVEFLAGMCDHMLKETQWVLDHGGDAIHTITARRTTRLLYAAKVALDAVPRDGDPNTVWNSPELQALLWAIGIDVPAPPEAREKV